MCVRERESLASHSGDGVIVGTIASKTNDSMKGIGVGEKEERKGKEVVYLYMIYFISL